MRGPAVTSRVHRLVLATAAAGLCLALLAPGAAGAAPGGTGPGGTGPGGRASGYTLPAGVTRECPAATTGEFECMALVRDFPSSAPAGYGPAELQSAYNLVPAAATGGAGQTVALLEVGDDPNAVSDFNAYRAQYGLPACDTATGAGCLTVVNDAGQAAPLPAADPAWAVQSSMDADTIAAVCANCHVLLAEAPSAALAMISLPNVYAVDHARIAVAGFGELSTVNSSALYQYGMYGVEIVAAAGDDGYGTQYPASSQFVTSVGGTTLEQAPTTTRGWTEAAWAGTGSGCVASQFKPSWQADTGCAGRTQNDVAAVADPQTGVSFYDTYPSGGGWGVGGGTNVSAAIVAATYALAGTPEAGSFPAQYPYRAGGGLYPVTSGSNGTCAPAYLCTAGAGFNGPAGLGTPDGTAAFTAPAGSLVTAFAVGANVNGPTAGTDSYLATVYATDTSPTEQPAITATSQPASTIAFSGQGCQVPATLQIMFCHAAIYGTSRHAGAYRVTATATGADGASSVSVPLNVADRVTVESDYNADVTLGKPVSLPINATSASGDALDFSVSSVPPGITWAKTGPDQITFTGKPTQAGGYSTTVTAANPLGGSAIGWIDWTAHGTITFKRQPNLVTAVGGAGAFKVVAADSASGARLFIGATGLPPGIHANLTFSPLESIFAGWPTRAGAYHVRVNFDDSDGATASESFTWTVRDDTSGPTGPIRLDLGGKCLDAGHGPRIWQCNGTGSQVWTMAKDGTVRARGECLTEAGTKARSRVVLARCTGAASQQWQIQTGSNSVASPRGNFGPALMNAASGRCLDDPGGARDGVLVVITGCFYGASDTWLTPAGPIESGVPGMCLADPGNRTANGTRLVLWACDGSASESFAVEQDGTVRIHGKCMYVNPRTSQNGAPVVLEACTFGNLGEGWSFYGAYPLGGQAYSPFNGDNLGAAGTANGSPVGVYRAAANVLEWRPL